MNLSVRSAGEGGLVGTDHVDQCGAGHQELSHSEGIPDAVAAQEGGQDIQQHTADSQTAAHSDNGGGHGAHDGLQIDAQESGESQRQEGDAVHTQDEGSNLHDAGSDLHEQHGQLLGDQQAQAGEDNTQNHAGGQTHAADAGVAFLQVGTEVAGSDGLAGLPHAGVDAEEQGGQGADHAVNGQTVSVGIGHDLVVGDEGDGHNCQNGETAAEAVDDDLAEIVQQLGGLYQTQGALLAEEVAAHDDNLYHRTGGGGAGGTQHTHVHGEDQDVVQRHGRHGAQTHSHHGQGGSTVITDEAGEEGSHHEEGEGGYQGLAKGNPPAREHKRNNKRA